MLQALLASAGLSPDDLEIVTYPDFGQAVALAEDQVDAATGFVNNEPVRLELAGTPTSVLSVDEITPLPGPGLVVGTETLRTREPALRAFVAATLRAMDEIIADPQRGVDAAVARIPELAEEPEAQRAILDATIATWQREGVALGAIDRDAWAESVEFMRGLPETPVARDVGVDELVDERLLPEG
jgi:NitT/TauT family transport system substrate-binding protein